MTWREGGARAQEGGEDQTGHNGKGPHLVRTVQALTTRQTMGCRSGGLDLVRVLAQGLNSPSQLLEVAAPLRPRSTLSPTVPCLTMAIVTSVGCMLSFLLQTLPGCTAKSPARRVFSKRSQILVKTNLCRAEPVRRCDSPNRSKLGPSIFDLPNTDMNDGSLEWSYQRCPETMAYRHIDNRHSAAYARPVCRLSIDLCKEAFSCAATSGYRHRDHHYHALPASLSSRECRRSAYTTLLNLLL